MDRLNQKKRRKRKESSEKPQKGNIEIEETIEHIIVHSEGVLAIYEQDESVSRYKKPTTWEKVYSKHGRKGAGSITLPKEYSDRKSVRKRCGGCNESDFLPGDSIVCYRGYNGCDDLIRLCNIPKGARSSKDYYYNPGPDIRKVIKHQCRVTNSHENVLINAGVLLMAHEDVPSELKQECLDRALALAPSSVGGQKYGEYYEMFMKIVKRLLYKKRFDPVGGGEFFLKEFESLLIKPKGLYKNHRTVLGLFSGLADELPSLIKRSKGNKKIKYWVGPDIFKECRDELKELVTKEALNLVTKWKKGS